MPQLKFIVDMNLSPLTVSQLKEKGWESGGIRDREKGTGCGTKFFLRVSLCNFVAKIRKTSIIGMDRQDLELILKGRISLGMDKNMPLL
ncbi:MAG: hypothetical protein JSV88_02240 [Candidatus Aminicenantes bacterium]|nr:MAG: hypothetical protein JSV88_02240 [Candidatus Aminicenantes bacterium]